MIPRTNGYIKGLILGLMLFVAAAGDCPMDGNMGMDPDDPNNPNDPNGADFAAVLTAIGVHVQGRIACGDGIIVYTAINPDETPFGPDYIVPGDTAGRGIANADDYDDDSFAVTGKKIALVRPGDVGVTIYDTETDTKTDIPTTDIRLKNIPINNYDAGHIQADGGYVATQNDANAVADGFVVKVIDITGATPVVIPFTNNPGGSDQDTEQVMVDAETKTVVAIRDDVIYVYDIDNPGNAPTEFDASGMGGIENEEQFAYDDGMIIYYENTTDRNVYVLDVTSAANTPVMLNGDGSTSANGRFAMRDGSYGYFYRSTPATGSGNAAGIGTMPNDTTPIIGSCDTIFADLTCCGRFSHGETMAAGLLNDQPIWFIGGQDDIGGGDPLQYSVGTTTWMTLTDPNDPDDNLSVGDVATNEAGHCLAFKHEINNNTLLGYVILNDN